MDDVKYLALYPLLDDDIEVCTYLGKIEKGHPYRFDKGTKDWVYDPEISLIYCGELDCEYITEEEAEYVKKRILNGAAAREAYKRWKENPRNPKNKNKA